MVLPVLLLTAWIGAAPAGGDVVELAGRMHHRSEWQASTFTMSAQFEAALDVAPDGGVVVVWSSRRQQGGRSGVYGQCFSPQGAALGSETRINVAADSAESAPDIALDASGRAWVVWQSHARDGDAGSIVARRFGGRLEGGPEFLLNQEWRGHQNGPVVACTPDGRALAAWTSAIPGSQGSRVRARLLGDGGAHGNEFALSSGAARREATPAVTADPRGGFAVAFAVASVTGTPEGIRFLRLGHDAGPMGEEIDVSHGSEGPAIEPAVAATSGGFIVTWLQETGDGHYVAVARALDAEGCPLGEPVAIDEESAGSSSAAAVAHARDGRSVVAWNRTEGGEPRIFARVIGADGAPLGAPLPVVRQARGAQALHAPTATRRLVLDAGGALVCAWSGDAGYGDSSSVNVTLLSPEPRELAHGTQGVTPEMMPAARGAAHDAAAPHEPPTFDPARVEAGQREIRAGADIGFTGIFNTGWTPPDPHLAIGPSHIVVIVNGQIAFFTREGNVTFQDQIEGAGGFWGSVGASNFVFDPEVLYDELSGRFFAMAAEAFAPGVQSYALVAVSDDSNPNGAWHRYRFNTTAAFGDSIDSPNIGVDAEAVYVTADQGVGAPEYGIFIYDKASLLAGAAPAVQNFLSLPTTTESAGIPPVTFDNPPALYMIEHRESVPSSTVRLIALQDPLGSPSLETMFLTVPSYLPPEDPPQQGTTVRPETFDARFWSVAYRNGSLWATHHVNSSRVLARWYEIAMNGWPDSGLQPALVQSGNIDPGPGIRTFFSSITADDHGNAAMCFARSSPSEFISMATAFRYQSDPLGTFQPPIIRQTTVGAYTTARWGDYSAVNVDPVNGITFWAHHEFAISNSWRTWIQAFTPVYAPADIDRNGLVGIGDLLILLAAWGPCADCGDCPADLDGDCAVGITDLLALLAVWG